MSTPVTRWIARGLAGASCVAALLVGPGSAAWAQDAKPTAPQAPPQMQGFPDLIKGLKETPGCLGVEAARTQSGKNVIFAWFENKKAVAAWYKSGVHRSVMKVMGTPGPTNPLKHVPDDAGPILIIASMTMGGKPQLQGTELPISQISVEIYQPLPGGASSGGTFAPAALEIPHHKRYEDDAVEPEVEAERAAAGKPAAAPATPEKK